LCVRVVWPAGTRWDIDRRSSRAGQSRAVSGCSRVAEEADMGVWIRS
jgi:hypothetical protein